MNQPVIEIPWGSYADMVTSLFKVLPGSQDILHAAVGISGEVGEIAASYSRPNLIEEFGDLEFFIEAGWQAVERKFNIRGGRSFHNRSFGNQLSDLVIASADFLDVAKKAWVYDKPIVAGPFLEALNFVEAATASMEDSLGLTRSVIQAKNMEKLAVRYSEGKYSNAAAQARKDKAE